MPLATGLHDTGTALGSAGTFEWAKVLFWYSAHRSECFVYVHALEWCAYTGRSREQRCRYERSRRATRLWIFRICSRIWDIYHRRARALLQVWAKVRVPDMDGTATFKAYRKIPLQWTLEDKHTHMISSAHACPTSSIRLFCYVIVLGHLHAARSRPRT